MRNTSALDDSLRVHLPPPPPPLPLFTTIRSGSLGEQEAAPCVSVRMEAKRVSAGGRGEEASERGSAASGVVYTNTLWRVINWEFTTRHFPPIVAAVGPSAALTHCITIQFGGGSS